MSIPQDGLACATVEDPQASFTDWRDMSGLAYHSGGAHMRIAVIATAMLVVFNFAHGYLRNRLALGRFTAFDQRIDRLERIVGPEKTYVRNDDDT